METRLTPAPAPEGDRPVPTRRHNWDAIFSRKKPFPLRRGADYSCSTSAMAQQLRNVASHRGVSVSIEETAEGLLVSIHPRTRRRLRAGGK